MNIKKMKVPIVSVFALTIVSANLLFTTAVSAAPVNISFETKLTDVALLSKFYNSSSKKFDRNSALQNQFAKTSVDIADEMYKATEEINQKGYTNFNSTNWNKYPNLKSFLTESDKVSKTGGVKINPSVSSSKLVTKELAVTSLPTYSTSAASSGGISGTDWITLLIRFGKEAAVRFVCGYFGNPQPNISQYALTWRNLPNSTTALQSWGYHQTNSSFGNGWTRAQSWSPWACGNNSYRDYASIVDSHTLKEKNYDGWNPRGEPNPEINTYKSPYLEWPVYVAWWHSNHQG